MSPSLWWASTTPTGFGAPRITPAIDAPLSLGNRITPARSPAARQASPGVTDGMGPGCALATPGSAAGARRDGPLHPAIAMLIRTNVMVNRRASTGQLYDATGADVDRYGEPLRCCGP